MSGSNPNASLARNEPVRPQPDWISSAITRIPYLLQIRATPWRNSAGGTTKPPSPWMGSMMAQATEDGSTIVAKARSTPSSASSAALEGSVLRYG